MIETKKDNIMEELKEIMCKSVFDIAASDMRRFAKLTNESFITSYLDTYLSGLPNAPYLYQVYQVIIYQLVREKHEMLKQLLIKCKRCTEVE